MGSRADCIDRGCFDAAALELWWRYLVERQRVWVRRALLDTPRPWTSDPVMATEFLTNVYRELDPGTAYVLDVVAPSDWEGVEDSGEERERRVLFEVLVYRLMGSSMELHSMARPHLDYRSFRPRRLVRELGGSQFGEAYRTAPYDARGGGSKLEAVSRVVAAMAAEVPELCRRLRNAHSARDMYMMLAALPGLGEFLANQAMVDVLTVHEYDGRWPFGTDDWCQPGPGARRGVAALLAPGVRPRNLLMVMAWLRDAQQEEFERLGLAFPYLVRPDDSPRLLTVCNVQTSLCEYGKYVRARRVASVRRYLSTPSRLEPYDVVLSDEELSELRDAPAVTLEGSTSVYLHDAEPPYTSGVGSDGDDASSHSMSAAAATNGQAHSPVVQEQLVVSAGAPASSYVQEGSLVGALVAQLAAQAPPAAHWAAILGLPGARRPQVVPVDPTGLLGLPKAVLIIPLD